ncbi:MAG TPA: molybdopterin-dependent oxidoreductase, partial [Acidobacteriota bacterium]
WYLKEANSVCPGCANGCNTRIHFNLDRRYKIEGRRVLRLKPRFNEQVNKWWLCDEGRYHYKWIDQDRIETPLMREPKDGGQEGPPPNNELKAPGWDTVLAKIVENIKLTIDLYGPDSIGVIASPQMTNEELYIVRKIFSEQLKVSLIRYHIPPKPEASEDSFLIKKDKNPNTRGAQLILDSQKDLPVRDVLEAAKNGKLKLLFVFHTDLVDRFGADIVREALHQVNAVIFHGTNKSAMLDFATHVLAAATYAEIEGTFTNFQGRVQRIFPAFAPLAESRATLRILRDLSQQLGIATPADATIVFEELRAHLPAFAEVDYASLGLSGKLVSQPASAAANP